jgi:putative peptidoglycan lipid II flippase
MKNSTLLDTFNAANNLPDVLFALISGGALAMAFIPLLTEYLTTKDRAAAWDLFSRVANVGFLVTGSIAILIAIFAQQLVDAKLGIAPGFDEEQRKLLAELMRLNLIGTVIFSISGLVMASLQANQHFVLPAIAPSMYNVGQIIGAIFLCRVMEFMASCMASSLAQHFICSFKCRDFLCTASVGRRP